MNRRRARGKRDDLEVARVEVRGRGLRVTNTRLAVLATLSAESGALSHAELVRRLGGDHERTTVFRALSALARVGLVQRIDLGDRVWRFRRAVAEILGPRATFVCTTCGSIEELEQLSISVARGPRAIARNRVVVVVQGECNACARSA